MSFFGRLKNIIKSNIYSKSDNLNISDIIIEHDIQNNHSNDTETSEENISTNSALPDAEYYAILEVNYGADFEEIKKSYRLLLKKYHPDLYHNEPEKFKTAEKLIEKINEAYSYFEQKLK